MNIQIIFKNGIAKKIEISAEFEFLEGYHFIQRRNLSKEEVEKIIKENGVELAVVINSEVEKNEC